ncbi:hypothetical protein [Desulfovibrio sp.]|uniref:hypothetical protein n=1 Tax=Desulfovibrio sp. TaxID=885 RepID=UPI0025B81F18|nr:hypothetical protein [Desulfovibrio sp.]
MFKISFLGLLGIIFIVLKLTGHIAWSWWWVTAPLWGGFVLLIVVVIIAYALTMPGIK